MFTCFAIYIEPIFGITELVAIVSIYYDSSHVLSFLLVAIDAESVCCFAACVPYAQYILLSDKYYHDFPLWLT